jgi:hypothetical protein
LAVAREEIWIVVDVLRHVSLRGDKGRGSRASRQTASERGEAKGGDE